MTNAKTGQQSPNLPKNRIRLAVFIGRFQPVHNAHLAVIRAGLAQADRVLVLLGSANEPRSVRNPFTIEERTQMLEQSLNDPRVLVRALEDSNYNLSEWIGRTISVVHAAYTQVYGADPAPSIALLGHNKDATSYYLNLFPQWASINVDTNITLSATDIREALFGAPSLSDTLLNTPDPMPTPDYLGAYTNLARTHAQQWLAHQSTLPLSARMVTPEVCAQLSDFTNTSDYACVCEEFAFVAKYRYAWRFAPYEPTFVTTDAVVVQSGHVLMVKRRTFPGKGQWALPGGFVDRQEHIEQAALRELKEETGIKVPEAVLRGHIKERAVFDAPFRSSRGRTVTHAFLIHLAAGHLPKIKSGAPKDAPMTCTTEAQDIAWIPLAQLRRDQCFEDHYSIIKNLTARI